MPSCLTRFAPVVRLAAVLLLAAVSLGGDALKAQAPVVLPNTIGAYAGGGAATTAGGACAANPNLKATDTVGNGCPATNAVFNGTSDGRGGLGIDGQGNVFVVDTNSNNLRTINGRTGIVSAYAGGGTSCGTANGQQDAYGDGCPVLQTGSFNHPRGMSVDPYGNVLIAGYGMNTVNIVCNALSPLCPNITGSKQVGSMYRVAGCVASATASGTAISTTTDNVAASPYGNLPNDGTTTYGTCATGVGGTNQARGVAADKYGNVYIADTANNKYRVVVGPASFNGVANPIAAVLALNTGASTYAGVTAANAVGKIYTILGAFTAPATGAVCGGPSGQKALDAKGDGCPFYQSLDGSGPQGIAVDSFGNIIFGDNGNALLRVLYMGGTAMANAINVNNAVTPVVGSVYVLAGTGTNGTGSTVTPSKGSTTNIDTNIFKVTLDPAGNIVIGDVNQVLFYDLTTGYIRKIFATGTACAAKLDTLGDGCAAGQSSFSGGSGLGVAYDPQGNLYITDTETTMLIRKIVAANLVTGVPTGTSLAQTIVMHGAAGTTGMTASLLNNSPDLTLGAPTCGTAAADNTLDCTFPITFAPTTPGLRAGTLAVTPAGISGSANYQLSAVATGAALATDSSAPVTAALGSGLAPVAVAVDGSSNVYAADTTSGNIVKITQTNAASVVGAALAGITQLATDSAGNVYQAAPGRTSVSKYTLSPNGTYTAGTAANGLLVGPAVTTGGSGYTAQPTVTLTGGGGGTGAQATANFSGGVVTSINITAAGSGYSTAPSVTISGGGGTGATATIQVAQPQAVTVDQQGNVYFADKSTLSLYLLPAASNSSSQQPLQTLATGFTNPTNLALDGVGNVYVADKGATSVFKIAAQNGTKTAVLTGVSPAGISADSAGNLYVSDANTASVYEVPVSGPATVTVLGGLTTPSGVAVDTNGIVYSADKAVASITQVKRNAALFAFGTNTALAFNGTLTDVGNNAATGSNRTDTADFTYVAGTANGCAFASNELVSQAIGNACTVTGSFAPQAGTGNVNDVLTYLPATSTGNITLTGTKSGAAVTTTTTISGETPANPVYASSGTEVTFTVTVAASAGNASGSVAVTVDTLAPVNYTLSNGVAMVALSGLTAGSHNISAIYATQNGFTGSSTAAPTTFSIAQATTSVTWNPSTTTQQVSAAIGTGVLDASAGTTPGYYLYTATSGGVATTIHAASYLPIGTYSLSVQFVPTDSTDFIGSTATVPTFTVTQATTTAALGTSQFLVAADGSGNYTSVQNAINAMPATGGSIYIKPGTYNGFVTVAYPNVALRGLGGDPTAVVLSNYAGAYSSPALINTQTNGNNNNQGDEGSATLVVAKTTAPNGTQPTPNNFYAGNLTLLNTYNTDNTIQNPLSTNSGSCAITTPASTNQTLYNAGKLCYSQALAIWITSDQAVMNNVYTTSLQDTIYNGSQGCGGTCVSARQYWWRGKVTGDVDYIFGDSASVFDRTSIYSAFHGLAASGTVTIEAQNKQRLTGSGTDYLSGDIMNSDVFTSQAPGMTSFYYGRPYGQYSTYITLNSAVDQVTPAGYIEFSGQTNLPTSTYAEFNTSLYTDPATGSPDANGVIYLGAGGNTGTGVNGARETTSQNTGTILANNSPKTQLSAAQATFYYPTAFLGATVPANTSYVAATPATYINTFTANWNPTTALATQLNAFVPSASATTVDQGSNVSILMRPQTPGGGILPTGTYTLFDGGTQIATGSLDAAGEASYSSKTLTSGAHSFTWTYSGDSNFGGSTTGTALNVNVSAGQQATSTTLSVAANNASVIYGTAVNVTAVVAATNGGGAGSATGNVTLTIDGSATINGTLVSGSYTFAVSGLGAGTHTYTAAYAGDTNNAASATSASVSSTVTKASLVVSAASVSRSFDTPSVFTYTVTGLVNGDTAATIFTGAPSLTSAAVRNSSAGTYPIVAAAGTLALTTAAANNYNTPGFANGTLTVTGGVPQIIVFDALPNFPSGSSYQLTGTATSGLALTYTVSSGNATIAGTKLTVTSAGPVTITAAQIGNSNYAAATSVSQTFTAQ